MNHIKKLFDELVETFDKDSSSERVEVLASDIAARLANQGITCVGLANAEWGLCSSLFVYIYKHFGIFLRGRKQSIGHSFIYLDIEKDMEPSSEFSGSSVIERFLTEARAVQELQRRAA
jgi:hypothetical protein